MRILVAFDDDYRAYADALSKAIGVARPHLNVTPVGLEALQTQVARLDPHLVICSLPNPASPEQEDEEEGKLLLAWVELSVDPHLPSQFCVDNRRWESLNPSLEELLDVVDETKLLVLSSSSSRRSEAC